MKKNLLFLGALLCGITSISAQVNDFTATDEHGKTWNLYELFDNEKVVVIHFAVPHCGDCRDYHSKNILQDLDQTFGRGGENSVQTMLVNLNNEPFSEFNWSDDYHFPTFVDGEGAKIYQELGVQNYTLRVYCPDQRMVLEDGYGLLQTEEDMRRYVAECSTLTSSKKQAVKENKKLNLFPNPAKEEIHLSIEGMESVNVQVLDVTGKLIKDVEVYNKLDISDLTSGMYMVKVEKTGEVVRFIKE